MAKVIVMNGLSLDGVMQGPGRPDEDTRGGFRYGGWGVPYGDQAMVAQWGERLSELTGGKHEWLFGRWTYEQLLAYWNAQGGPFKAPLNDIHKYVASTNPETKLEWPNSTLLRGDVPAAVAELKERSETDLVIMGSGVLIRSLIAHELIDEYLITIAPVVLGTGTRMFSDGVRACLRLTHSVTTGKGVIIATYQTVRADA
jgi:dihydrofolate reductase